MTMVELDSGAPQKRAAVRHRSSESDRPALLMVDNRPSEFTRYVLNRPDIDVVLLRFDDFAERIPHWPPWGRLPAGYREATADVPAFDVRVDRPLAAEAARYRAWAASLPRPARYFCNPEEHVQGIAQRFAGLVGLPHLSERQVDWVRDKASMKDRFAQLGIPAAHHQRIDVFADVRRFAERYGWPVVLKPIDSFATIDTYRIDGPGPLAELAKTLPRRRWMVEEFVAGKEYQLCALVARGRVLDTYLSINPSPLLDTLAGSMNADVTVGPHCPEYGLRDLAAPLVERLVDGMSLDHGYLHMEFFVRPDGQILMSEIGARLAGCGIPVNHGLALGFDIFGATLDTYLQRVPKLSYSRARCVGDLLLPAQVGRIVALTPIDQLLSMPGVIGGHYDVAIGDVVAERRASNARSGLIYVEGVSTSQVLARMQSVLDTFSVSVG